MLMILVTCVGLLTGFGFPFKSFSTVSTHYMDSGENLVLESDTKIEFTIPSNKLGTYEVQNRLISGNEWLTVGSRFFGREHREPISVGFMTSSVAVSDETENHVVRVLFTPLGETDTRVHEYHRYRLVRNKTMPTAGIREGFMYLDNTKPARWNPCQVVTYHSEMSRLSKQDRRSVAHDVDTVFATLSRHSGLTFQKVPHNVAPMVRVRFDEPLKDSAAGTTTVETKPVTGTGFHEILSAEVFVKPGLRDGWRHNVLVHELMHTLGVGHSPVSKSVMTKIQTDGLISETDREALKAVGATQGCF